MRMILRPWKGNDEVLGVASIAIPNITSKAVAYTAADA